MFTVKLYRDSYISKYEGGTGITARLLKLVQSKEVNIYKDEELKETEIVTDDESFFLKSVKGEPKSGIDYYDCAYIENERGSTTQRVFHNLPLD